MWASGAGDRNNNGKRKKKKKNVRVFSTSAENIIGTAISSVGNCAVTLYSAGPPTLHHCTACRQLTFQYPHSSPASDLEGGPVLGFLNFVPNRVAPLYSAASVGPHATAESFRASGCVSNDLHTCTQHAKDAGNYPDEVRPTPLWPFLAGVGLGPPRISCCCRAHEAAFRADCTEEPRRRVTVTREPGDKGQVQFCGGGYRACIRDIAAVVPLGERRHL